MDVVTTKEKLREARAAFDSTAVIGLVPTMGNLHAGHMELIKQAQSKCTVVIATIFVNPLQFGPNEDFSSYPRVLEKDSDLLRGRGVHLLFAPSVDEMYPRGGTVDTNVSNPHLTTMLCGERRPGHFDGVATVVGKLFNLTQPDIAFFGEKDWQQLTLIRGMASDLDFPIDVVAVPTVRNTDGLALSSRNSYLDAEERKKAPLLYSTLVSVKERVLCGDTRYSQLEDDACTTLALSGFVPDYISVREGASLQKAAKESTDRRVFGAAFLGKARLIDNIAIDA